MEENASRSRRPDYKLIGHLESSKEACLRNRTMKFLARTADGATVVLGTGRTNGSGTWRLVGAETTTHGERLKVTQKSREVVNSINDWLGGHSRQIAMTLCLGAGAFLLIRGLIHAI